MGFLSSLTKAVARTALLPLDAVADASRAVQGKAPRNTERSAGKIAKNVTNAVLDPFGDDDDDDD